jgi:hypothetical protein
MILHNSNFLFIVSFSFVGGRALAMARMRTKRTVEGRAEDRVTVRERAAGEGANGPLLKM